MIIGYSMTPTCFCSAKFTCERQCLNMMSGPAPFPIRWTSYKDFVWSHHSLTLFNGLRTKNCSKESLVCKIYNWWLRKAEAHDSTWRKTKPPFPSRAHLTRITPHHTTNQNSRVITQFTDSQITAGVNHFCASSGCETPHWHCKAEAMRILVFVCGNETALERHPFVKQLTFWVNENRLLFAGRSLSGRRTKTLRDIFDWLCTGTTSSFIRAWKISRKLQSKSITYQQTG